MRALIRTAAARARVVVALWASAAGSTARADEARPCGVGAPWVQLRDAPFDADFRAQLVAQLRAGLGARHIDLCTDGAGAAAPASEVSLDHDQEGAVSVTVRDAVTGKQLARTLDLRATPLDARPLTIALAVDELLRAGWAELVLPDAPVDVAAVPPEISRAGVPAAASAGTRNAASRPSAMLEPMTGSGLAVAFVDEHFGGGLDQLGAQVTARIQGASPAFAELGLGVRTGLPARATDGNIDWTAVNATVGGGLTLRPRARRWRLDVIADGWLTRGTFAGRPAARAFGQDGVATAVYVDVGLEATVRLTRWFGLLVVGELGVPVHSVELLDGDRRVAGFSGPLLSTRVGGWWRFP